MLDILCGSEDWIDLTLYYWGRDNPEDDMEWMLLTSGNLNSWTGYFIKSHYDNMTLIRQN